MMSDELTKSDASQPFIIHPSSFTVSSRRWLTLLLVVITLAVYAQSIPFELVNWDDDIHLYENSLFKPLTGHSLVRFWRDSYAFLYVPVSYTFFAAEVWLSELISPGNDPFNPVVFHTGSVLLHTLCVVLVFRLLWRLIGHAGAAFVGALLFSLHPLQVESVCWVSETRGLLSMALSLAALLWYLRAIEDEGEGGRPQQYETSRVPPPPFHLPPYLLATVFFVLATLAKPAAVTLPLVVAALDYFLVRRNFSRLVGPVGIWCGIALVIVVVTKALQGDTRIDFVTPLAARPLIAGDALAFYLRKLVLPVDLGFDYGRRPVTVLAGPWVYVAWLLPCVTAVGVLAVSRHRATWLAGMAIVLAGLLPVLGLVPFLYQDISTVADRYMYLPMFGVSLAVAGWLARHWSRAMAATCGLLLGIWVAADMVQIPTWRNSDTLFVHGLEVNPQSFMAEYTLGIVAQKRGNLDEAMAHYRRAIDIHPQYAQAWCYLGRALNTLGELDEAVRVLRKAVQMSPHNVEALTELGIALTKQGHPEEAIALYREALVIANHEPTQIAMGDALLQLGRYPEALERYYNALELEPRSGLARAKVGEVLVKLGEFQRAEQEFHRAIQDDPKLAEAQGNLGALEMKDGRFREALEHLNRALKLKPSLSEVRYNRALVLLELGLQTHDPKQLEEARAALRETLLWVPADSPVAQGVQELLENEAKEEGERMNEE